MDTNKEIQERYIPTHSRDGWQEESFDLSGRWDVSLSAYSSHMETEGQVWLPGTLDTNKKGTPNFHRAEDKLSRYFAYTGPATYQRTIYANADWAGKNVQLYMERSRQTAVWINGLAVPAPQTANILPVPQRYDITPYLRFGQENTIAIQVDNSYPGLPKDAILRSHMATEETQTNWNGIVGAFLLQIREPVRIAGVRVYPKGDLQSVRVEADVVNGTKEMYDGRLTFRCAGAPARDMQVSLAAGEIKTLTLADYAMPDDVQLWSEFHTPLYQMTVRLDTGSAFTQTFGMRAFSAADGHFTINGQKTFLRSEANCAVFPLTGYAPMDEAGWEKLFTTYQSYGVNAVRFHSWCPPEAAFRVADRLGLYLQPELSDWDMDMFATGERRDYYAKEAFAILREYASHPSFVMLSFGNEPQYRDDTYAYADGLIEALKQQDATRLYSPGSNILYDTFGGITPSPHTDYYTAQSYKTLPLRGAYGGMDGFINRQHPASTVTFDESVQELNRLGVPVYGHEVGQFQVFPDILTEPERYTGVLEPRNLQDIAARAGEKGMDEKDIRQAIEASGMLSRLAYKAEIEAAFRTKGMSGISLLGLQDFPGQGTALVGMMNAFGQPKPYAFADPKAFSAFFGPTNLLFQTSKFCWTTDEDLTGNLLFSNYAQHTLEGKIRYSLSYKDGALYCEGKTPACTFAQGELTNAAAVRIPLQEIKAPAQLTLEIACQGARNSYSLWVYPAGVQADESGIYVTGSLDDTAAAVLQKGGRIFFSPEAAREALPKSIKGNFTTAFWSSMFTGENQPGTMGLLLDPDHPLFAAFPTDFYSDYQWWAMSGLGRPMNLEGLRDEAGKAVAPIVKVLDGFAGLANLGLLFEAAVGEGRLMVSSMGLEQLQYTYPEARALRRAIIGYMQSDAFHPDFRVSISQIRELVAPACGDKA